jgi:hypothetical protein
VAGIASETDAVQTNTTAVIANATANKAGANATDLAGKSAKGATGFFTTLNAVIRANPIGVVITALGALGAIIFALSSKFKPFAAIINGIKDAFGGVVQVFKDVANNSGLLFDTFTNLATGILSLINPINNVKRALNSLGAEFEVDSIESQFDKVKKAAEGAGDSIASSFEKGAKRAQQLRALDARETLNDATDINAQLEESALGSARNTSDGRRAIRLRELKEDQNNALERLKLENDLTEGELAILRSGNIEKIKELDNLKGFDTRFYLASDNYLNIQMAAFAPVVLLPKVFFKYRMHEGQAFNQKKMIIYSYLYNKELYLNGNLPLTKDELNFLLRKLEKRHFVNIVKFLFETKSINDVFNIIKDSKFKWWNTYRYIFY